MDWYREAEPVPHLATVAAAVWNEQQLTMRYESWSATAARTVSPLGLVLKAGAWYLVAAASDDEARTYRVSNMRDVQTLPARARRPRKFDLVRYWAESLRRFERELYKGEAVLLATPAGVKALHYLSSAVAKTVADAPASRREDGRVRVRIPIESIEHATGQLLRLAPDVEVIEPQGLRRSVVRRLRYASSLYGLP